MSTIQDLYLDVLLIIVRANKTDKRIMSLTYVHPEFRQYALQRSKLLELLTVVWDNHTINEEIAAGRTHSHFDAYNKVMGSTRQSNAKFAINAKLHCVFTDITNALLAIEKLKRRTHIEVLDAWLVCGKLHKDGGAVDAECTPAITYLSGDESGHIVKEWHHHGLRNRSDGPAVITPYEEVWFQYGIVHRSGGPARIKRDGSKISHEWYSAGRLHRTNGPAVVHYNADKVEFSEWYCWGSPYRDCQLRPAAEFGGCEF